MERTDDLGINNLKLIQDTDLFCFGTDAVLLTDFVRVKKGGKIVDLCTGNGIIPVLLSAKTKAESITGIEILKESYDLAVRSAKLNNLTDKVHFINDDLKNWKSHFECGRVDAVTCNPPYMKVDSGFKSPKDLKAMARHEVSVTLDDITKAASGMLKFGGYFYIVHRADRLCDVICSMRNASLEPKRLAFVHPDPKRSASLILVEGMKGAMPSLKLENPIYVNWEEGK
jgi:tRNA1(Val) A37 N6-methylase TrmN6